MTSRVILSARNVILSAAKDLLLLTLLVPSYAKAQECIGESSYARKAIYFHGIDDLTPAKLEQANRDVLRKLAASEHVQFFVARSKTSCKQNSKELCWQHYSKEEVMNLYKENLAAAAKCFGKSDQVGLIGFSNGGYLASKIYHFCLEPRPSWVIVVGSAGTYTESASLKNCSRLKFVMGARDLSLGKAKKYFEQLKAKKGNVDFQTYPGGHYLDFAALQTALKQLP
jgi:predicted esterase